MAQNRTLVFRNHLFTRSGTDAVLQANRYNLLLSIPHQQKVRNSIRTSMFYEQSHRLRLGNAYTLVWSGQLQHMKVKDGIYTRVKRNILRPLKCGATESIVGRTQNKLMDI